MLSVKKKRKKREKDPACKLGDMPSTIYADHEEGIPDHAGNARWEQEPEKHSDG
jgi:hypothetical protein